MSVLVAMTVYLPEKRGEVSDPDAIKASISKGSIHTI